MTFGTAHTYVETIQAPKAVASFHAMAPSDMYSGVHESRLQWIRSLGGNNS